MYNSIGWDGGAGILAFMWKSLNDVDRSKIRQENPKTVFPYFWNFIEKYLKILSEDVAVKAFKIEIVI